MAPATPIAAGMMVAIVTGMLDTAQIESHTNRHERTIKKQSDNFGAVAKPEILVALLIAHDIPDRHRPQEVIAEAAGTLTAVGPVPSVILPDHTVRCPTAVKRPVGGGALGEPCTAPAIGDRPASSLWPRQPSCSAR